MKSPQALAAKLAGQWRNASLRERRLLDDDVWPLKISIGKPSPESMRKSPQTVMAHVQAWRQVRVGSVQWEDVQYRTTSEAVSVPTSWVIATAQEWIAAAGDEAVEDEFVTLTQVLASCDAQFHSVFVRQLSQLRTHGAEPLIRAAEMAVSLEPGCAEGAPLRTLALAGNDSKFFERHRALLTRLLDMRFEGLAGELGLEGLLDATLDRDHWLLVLDLDGGLLPFRRMRVSDRDIAATAMPAGHVLIIENEQCAHGLPRLANTVAILGAGLNLSWMKTPWLATRRVGYWGDIDSWGLTMLARARQQQPQVEALMMTAREYSRYGPEAAVVEPSPNTVVPQSGLDDSEQKLFTTLLASQKGRLEQEFLPSAYVREALARWHMPIR